MSHTPGKDDKPPIPPSSSSTNKSSAAMFMTPSTPPVFISFEELTKVSSSVANMALAHEIAIDDDFKLQKYDSSSKSLENVIRQTMMTAFWDMLQSQLSAVPPDYSQALALLKDVREDLKGLLLPSQDKVRAKIDEQIDLDMVKQQLDNNTFDLRSYATLIVDLMGKMCAPVRDSDIVALRAVTDPVALYKDIFRVLDLMKMDMANFTIAQMRPFIQQQSVTYERKKFQEYLDTQTKMNIDGLKATKAWLTKVHSSNKSIKWSPSILLSKAYLNLLDWDMSQTFPECCVMDEIRLRVLGETVKKLVLISTLFLVTSSGYKMPSDSTALRDLLKNHCMVLLTDVSSSQFSAKKESIVDQIILDVTKDAETNKVKFDSGKKKELRASLMQAFDCNHKVHKLLSEKILDYLYNSIVSDHKDPLQIPQGFSVVQSEFNQTSRQFVRIVAHNRNVFGPHYDKIIQNVLVNIP